MKIKRRELLKLFPAVILGSSITAEAESAESIEEVEVIEETKGPDCYVGLLNNRGELHEIEGSGYARQGIKWKFVTPAGESKLINAKDVTFPAAKADWGDVTHFALYVEPQGGVILFTAALAKPWFIHTDDTVRFVAGDLDITID